MPQMLLLQAGPYSSCWFCLSLFSLLTNLNLQGTVMKSFYGQERVLCNDMNEMLCHQYLQTE